eukprot:9292147-Heterocapsa_arctica.AAC.1
MEQHEEKYTIHELDCTAEDRQGVQHGDGAECSGSETAKQIGSSEDPKEQVAAVHQIESSNTKRMADYGELQ